LPSLCDPGECLWVNGTDPRDSKTGGICAPFHPTMSGVQINPNCEQLSTEEADCGGIAGAARQLIGEPSLAFAWIIVGKQVGCARVPASPKPITQLQAHVRITHNIADVPSFLAVLCHDPKLPSNESVANGGAARLSGLAANRFQEPISWGDKADRKQKLDGRVKQIFLKKVDYAMFHRLVLMDENYIFTLGTGGPEVSEIDFASIAIIGRRDQIVRAPLLACPGDPSLKFQRL